MDTGVIGELRVCDSTFICVGLVLTDERDDYEKGIGEACSGIIRESGVSGSQQYASKCEGLSALREILDWCIDAYPIRFVAARFPDRLPWKDLRVENTAVTSPGRGVGPQ